MTTSSEADRLLIERIRGGDSDAWTDLISKYEGRLLAFVESRPDKSRSQRRHRPRSIRRILEQPAKFRRPAFAGKLFVSQSVRTS